MAITQLHRDVAIGTPLGDDVLLLQKFLATEKLGGMFCYELDLFSESRQVSADQIVGKNISVRVLCDGGVRFFNGYVRDFTCISSAKQLSEYKATAVPWLWFLTQNRDCRIFQNLSIPEIIEKVFNDRGFSDFENALTEQYEQLEYCVQYCETDYDFVTRLMERSGIYYYFRHENQKHILILCDSGNIHCPFEKYETIKYKPYNAKELEETINDWEVKTSVVSNQAVVNDFDFKNTRQDLLSKAIIPNLGVDGSLEVYEYPGKYSNLGKGERIAGLKMQQLHLPHQLCRGQSFSMGIRPGYVFTLSDCPQKDQNREYLTINCKYTVEAGGFETGQSNKGLECGCEFEVIPSDKQYRMPSVTPVPRIEGPQTAIVTGPAAEEIYTDKYGRIKVKFHWDRYGKADENSSCWIRVSQGIAGNKWGMISLPRIGQEVIVEHEEGDPDKPIITGRVYNGQAMPPYSLPEKKTVTTTKSNSSKGGGGYNEVRFEDLKDKEQIFVNAQRDKDENVGRNSYTTVQKDCHDVVKGNLFERVKKDYNEKIYKNHIKEIGEDYNLTVDGSVIEDVKNDQTLLVANKYQISATDIIQETSATISHKTNKHVTEAAVKCSVKAGEICIEGSRAICLKVGGSVVSITPAGIDINGTMVKINSGAMALALGAAAPVVEPAIALPPNADYSDDGTPGGNDKKSPDGSLKPLKVMLKKQKAPDYIPHPNTVIGYVKGPEELVDSRVDLSIKRYIPEIICSHKRQAGKEKILQVIASRTSSFSPLSIGGFAGEKDDGIDDDTKKQKDYFVDKSGDSTTAKKTKELGRSTAKANQTFNKAQDVVSWLPKIEFDVSDGEKDAIVASIVDKGTSFGATGQLDGKIAVVSNQTLPSESQMKTGSFAKDIISAQFHKGTSSQIFETGLNLLEKYKTIKEHYKWLCSDCSDRYYAHFLMPDSTIEKSEIYSYPAVQSKIQISTEAISKLVHNLNEKFFKRLEPVFRAGPASCSFEIVVASGFISFEYGWEEDDDWKCFFSRKIEAGFDPLFSIELSGKASMLAVAGMFFGVPPALSRFFGEALGDVIIFLDIIVKLILKGSKSFMSYYSPKSLEKAKGEFTVAVAIPIEFGIEARLGSEYLVSLSIKGSFTMSFDFPSSLVIDDGTVCFHTEFTGGPIEGKVTVKATGGIFFKREKTKIHTFIEKFNMCEPKTTQIWPSEEN